MTSCILPTPFADFHQSHQAGKYKNEKLYFPNTTQEKQYLTKTFISEAYVVVKIFPWFKIFQTSQIFIFFCSDYANQDE